MTINADHMQGKRLTVGILYPPIEELSKPKLTSLYARISERYPEEYENFTILPDGALLASAVARCTIQAARLQLVYDLGSFQVALEKSVDIMHLVVERLELSQFFQFGVKINAIAPMKAGSKQASQFLEEALLCIPTDLLDQLGSKRLGVGLHAWADKEDVLYELKIEPLLGDQSHVYLEVDAQYPGAFVGLENIKERINRVYDYMFKDVKAFLAELKQLKK